MITAREIQRRVAEHYQMPEAEIAGRSRSRRYVFPRQVAMYVAHRALSHYSLADIGEAFGGRAHGTVTCAIEAVERHLATGRNATREINVLLAECGVTES